MAMSQKRKLASLALDVFEFTTGGIAPVVDEFVILISNCHPDTSLETIIDTDVSYETTILNTENTIGKLQNCNIKIKSNLNHESIIILLKEIYNSNIESDTDLINYKHSLMLILYQLINNSQINKIAAYSEKLIDLLLELLGTIEDKWLDFMLSILIIEFSDMGFNSDQLMILYKHCYKMDKYSNIFYKIFDNNNTLNQSVIFDNPENQLEFKNISFSKSKSTFVISTWLRLSHSNTFSNLNSSFGSFKLFSLNKNNGNQIITYLIDNGEIQIITDREAPQSFASFQLEINKLYNISFAHISEGKKKTRIDVFINGLLIETKVINNIFANFNENNKSIFSYNNIDFSNVSYDLTLSGPSNLKNNLIMEISSLYIIESQEYLQWVIYLYMLGPTYSGKFTNTNLLRLLSTHKQIDLHILLNKQIGKLDNSSSFLQFKREDILLFWEPTASNLKTSQFMNYEYTSCKKIVTRTLQNNSIQIKYKIPLMDILNSIGGFSILLRLISNSNSNNSLIKNLEFLFKILKNNKIIENNFISSSGYEILAALLKFKREFISIEVLDLVLIHSGYNNVKPSESIIKNKMAYKSMVLNFDLWQCTNISQNKIINKFLLFQFTVFIQESKYNQYNLEQMKDMKIVKRIILALKRDDFNENILPVTKNILWIIVRDNHPPDIVKSLFLHLIFSINVVNHGKSNSLIQLAGAESILEIIKNLVEEQPKILKAFNFNFLLSLMKGSSIMKKNSLEFLIKIIGSDSKEYSKFLSIGGFSMLTNLLKNDWDNNDILVLIFMACFKIKPSNIDNLTINVIVFSLSETILNQLWNPHFLGLLNNLMKFAALNLKDRNSSASILRLNNYIDMLIVLKRKSNFDEIYFKNQEWMGSLIFLTMVIKKSGKDSPFIKYSKFLNELLIDRLYTDENEENLSIIENLYGEYQIEFNNVIIPLLFNKLKSFQSLMIMILNNTNKIITLCRILICYFQSYSDTNIDNFEYLSNFEILTLVIKKMLITSKSNSKLLPFLKVLVKEFIDSYTGMLMFYINNVPNLNNNEIIGKLTTCCQIFMSNYDIIGRSLNCSAFILLFSTFYKLSKTGEEIESLSLNCIRVLLLERQNIENVLDETKIAKKDREHILNILKNTLTLDDENAIKVFSEDIKFSEYFDRYYKKNFDNFVSSPMFHPGSEVTDDYLKNKFKLEKSNKILEKEIGTFNKIIYNQEMKNVNSNTQDEIDDFHHYMSVYESLMGNISYPTIESHKMLYPTEGKNRKRNKIINVLSTKYMNFANCADESDISASKDDDNSYYDEGEEEAEEEFLNLHDSINELNIISKLQSDEDFNEDRNRRILRNLYVHDQIDTVYNVTQIIGLDAVESILILGSNHIYIVEGYFYSRSGEICRSYEAPDNERDEVVKLLNGLTFSSQDDYKSLSNKLKFSKSKSWMITNLVSISKRKFLLRDVGFEIFFNDGSSVLLTCISNSKRNSIFNKINSSIISKLEDQNLAESLKLASQQKITFFKNDGKKNESNGFNFVDSILLNSSDILSSKITYKWCNGEISNFQYLMLINTIAGRTFNDLTQYPVFPFVLSDYTSDEIDLDDVSVYRNFSKPMGAQNPIREQQFKDRYEATKEMSTDTPPFHYGTHYSSAMIVASYLIRLDPFTESHLKLQGGKFDHPDRLFYSIPKLWNSASSENTTDVRELIPEFYYLPDFLTNLNNIDFGHLQDGNIVNDVELPPWAKNDPIKFVRIMRNALESDYVSEHLPDWIDLIFGYKQQGIESVNATNVFHYLSYPGSIDIEKIYDDHEKAVVISIIHNFGQTPLQIFKKKHPMKNPECYLNKVSIKDSFKMNFQNILQTDSESKQKIQYISEKNLKRLYYNYKNNKWIGIPDKVYIYIQDNYMFKIEIEGIDGLCINDIHHFEQFSVGGCITCIKILSKDRFIVGFNTGELKLLEYSNDKYKYVINAQRSIVKMENNFLLNNKKKGIFQTFQSGNNNNFDSGEFLLLNIGSLNDSHKTDIIKIEYMKNDRIIITLDKKRKWLTIWHEPNKSDQESGEIFKMNEIMIDDYEIKKDDLIIDFEICENDNTIYCITKKNKLIIWRINGGLIFNEYIDNSNNNNISAHSNNKCEKIKLCENFNERDYDFGKLFIIKYLNEDDDIKFSVFYISREFNGVEEIMDIDIESFEKNTKIEDIKMLNYKNGEFLVIMGTMDGIKFIK